MDLLTLDAARRRTADAGGTRAGLIRLALAGSVGALLGAAAVVTSPLLVLGGLLLLGCTLALLRRPELGLLAVVTATSTIVFEGELPLISIGVGSLHLSDVVLLALLGMIAVRALAEREFRIVRTPLDLPLLAFYAIGLLSTALAVARAAVPAQEALRSTRIFTYYLTFFAVTNLVRSRAQMVVLVDGLLVLATVVAAAMAAQFVLGDSVALFPGRIETLQTQGESYGSITRVLPPGQSLVLVAPVVLLVILVLNRFRPATLARACQLSLLGLGVILTFNRNFWVAVGVAMFLLAVLARGADRRKLLGLALAVLLLAALLLAFASGAPDSRAAGLAGATLARLTTLFDAGTLREDSLAFRYVEYDYAIPQILAHPLVGLGLGAHYRPWDGRLDWEKFDGRGYIHNGHLWMMLATGLLGYACLFWLSVRFVWRGLRSWQSVADPFLRAIVFSSSLAYVGATVAALVNPIYMQWFWTPVIGIMMGASETILHACRSLPAGVRVAKDPAWIRD